MKKKMVSVLLAAAMGTTALVGFGTTAYADDDVLEFYHGYYQDESEWAAAQVMRDIYDEFAKEHADGSVTFKPIAVENRDDIVSAQVAGGSFPDLVDVGGGGVPQAALSQDLVYDLKPYIDENGLQDAVGLNYTQHDMDGHIYAVHDQIESRGLWYNSDIFEKAGITEEAVILVEDTSREHVDEMMRLRDYIDVLIPRGGKQLIDNVVNHSTVPVIETGTGNCHIFVDETADLDMAVPNIVNAKTQRLGVCNACESLVIHEKIAEEAVPAIYKALHEKGVEVRGDERIREIVPEIVPATEEDWGTEYLDAIISVKIVSSVEEAIAHINKYNTGHSESIITKDYTNALKFQDEIDAAAVYVNASTRFTDGFEFGFGAEIGISTQKLHARGPMGLEALTTTKYVIFGDGQIRP